MEKTKVNKYNDQTGFTLVEVLASLVIISILLLGVGQLFTFTSTTAQSNNAKLVTTHLAKATIERMKVQPGAFFKVADVGGEKVTYSRDSCEPENCEDLYQLQVNNQLYGVTVHVSQSEHERELSLINVVVEVQLVEKNTKSVVEGYVIDEVSEK